MNPDIMSLIQLFLTVVSVSLVVYKGIAESNRNSGKILEKISQIESSIKEIREENKDISGKLSSLENRVVKLEAYAKSDNERLNRLEGEHEN